MKKKDKKEELIQKADLSKVANIMNNIIISGQIQDDTTSMDDSLVDIINNYTSGMALGSCDIIAYAKACDEKSEYKLANYFYGLNSSIKDANHSVQYMYIRHNLQRIFVDHFYTLMGQLENEFDWMKPSFKKRLKLAISDVINTCTFSVTSINLDSILYTIQATAVINTGNSSDYDYDMMESFIAPYANSIVNRIVAETTKAVYDAFFEELITEISLQEFDYVCEFIKPYIIDFRDDILQTVVKILLVTLCTRVTTTYEIYNQVKQFTEDLDIPYYGY